MLTDIFCDRYPDKHLKSEWTERDRRFMHQSVTMLETMFLSKPEWSQLGNDMAMDHKRLETSFNKIHDQLCHELGVDSLTAYYGWGDSRRSQQSPQIICSQFITSSYDDQSEPSWHIALRLSLIELGFRHHGEFISNLIANHDANLEKAKANDVSTGSFSLFLYENYVTSNYDRFNNGYNSAVYELNERLRRAGYPLNYHNGFFQFTDDDLTTDEIHEPFWALVDDPMWSNVDLQMKEAIDRRDNADRTAAFHAVSALESVVKIISGTKGWDTGNEKGAANYVDNLGSKRGGNFIEQWEAELLKKMFTDVRNPFAHGPGQAPMPSLSVQQTNWAIDTAMSWTKSLIQRM